MYERFLTQVIFSQLRKSSNQSAKLQLQFLHAGTAQRIREWIFSNNRYTLTKNTSAELINGLEFGMLNGVKQSLW